jgi:hypothetical protein
MQEQNSKLEKIINLSIDKIKQKMHSICEKEYEKDLDFHSAIDLTNKIKDVVSELGCQVLEGFFESKDEEAPFIILEGRKYLNKGKSRKQVVTCLY